jgi:hypothetical protein
MLPYAELLLTTYADQRVSLEGADRDFVFTIYNPEWEEGNIVITCENGALTLTFATMNEPFDGDFGDMVELIDELLHDESMIFEVYSQGKDVLGGSRGTDEIDIDHTIPRFVRSLCEGDRDMHAELKEIIAKGQCYCKLRGWRKERNRSILLS